MIFCTARPGSSSEHDHMTAEMTLLDLLGTDPQVLYTAGQALVTLEGMQLRQPDLRVLLLDTQPPQLLALSQGRLFFPPSGASLDTDLSHTSLLKAQCMRELAVAPLDMEALGDAALYEIRISSVVGLRRATWDVASAADECLAAQQQHAGSVLARWSRQSRARLLAAEEAWPRSLEALMRQAAQLPVRELTGGAPVKPVQRRQENQGVA